MSPEIRMGVAATLLSCAGARCLVRPDPSVAQAKAPSVRTIAYRCPDLTGFRASVAATGASVKLEGLASGPVTLPIAPSASGAKYSDGRTIYWAKGAEATLEIPGESPRVCVVIADLGMLPRTRWRLVRIQSMDGTEAIPTIRQSTPSSCGTMAPSPVGLTAIGSAVDGRPRGNRSPLGRSR